MKRKIKIGNILIILSFAMAFISFLMMFVSPWMIPHFLIFYPYFNMFLGKDKKNSNGPGWKRRNAYPDGRSLFRTDRVYPKRFWERSDRFQKGGIKCNRLFKSYFSRRKERE